MRLRLLVPVLVPGLLVVPPLLRLLLLLSLALGLFALCFGKHPQVVLSVLLKIFRSHPVIRQLCIARQLIVLVDNLLRCAAHLALGA